MSGTALNGENSRSNAEPAAWRRVSAFVEPRSRILFVAFFFASGVSFAGSIYWLFDNLTAFVPQFAAVGVVFAIGFAVLRSPRWAFVAIVLAVLHAARLWIPGDFSVPSAGSGLKFVSANVKTSNHEYDRFLRFVRRESPDLLLVIEIDQRWADALKRLDDDYPYSIVEPRDDNFGIALLSRNPLTDARVVPLGDADVPTVVARLVLGKGPVTVIGTHPLPPVRAAIAAARNRQLRAVARLAADDPHEVVVMGDLNVAPWSPHFRDLLRDGGLRDSRQGVTWQPTWPTYFPPLMTPIDHLLTSDGLAAGDRRVGPDIGSDHRPILATLRRAAAP